MLSIQLDLFGRRNYLLRDVLSCCPQRTPKKTFLGKTFIIKSKDIYGYITNLHKI